MTAKSGLHLGFVYLEKSTVSTQVETVGYAQKEWSWTRLHIRIVQDRYRDATTRVKVSPYLFIMSLGALLLGVGIPLYPCHYVIQ